MTTFSFGFLKEIPGLSVRESVRWADSTSLGAGIGSFVLAEPESMDELSLLCRKCAEYKISLFPVGGGTNLVGSDSPVDFLGVRLSGEFRTMKCLSGNRISAGAGARLSALFDFALANSLGGGSGLAGIPGSIGGALRMNAGANGMEIADFVREIDWIDSRTGERNRMTPDSSRWSYRESPLPEWAIVTFAVFEFKQVEIAKERELLLLERKRRARVTPKGRSAGSVFRNPSPDFSAGFLLERAGAKGLSSGAANVSMEHANWIVTFSDRLSESDCTALAVKMASMVKASCGIALKTELRFVNMESKQKVDKAAAPLKILLLKGGTSAEREVSLISGAAVAEALRKSGHEVREYDITELKITDDMRRADVIYPVLHGGFGEDGTLQKMLEDAHLKFVGSGSQACIDIMDKIVSKKIMDDHGIRNPQSRVIDDINAPMPKELGLPLIVKPPKEGSTFGLSLVNDESEWKAALELCFRHGRPALVEQYISGVESTVGILNGKALPLVEIRYPGKLYDYDAKYTHAHGETKYICPPTGISEKAQKESQEFALKFYQASGARDMLRVDVIVSSKDDSVWVLEGNGLPGCTPSSLLPKAAKTAGISFEEMCSTLAYAAAER